MDKLKMTEFTGNIYKCLLVAHLLFTLAYGSPLECCQSEIGWKNDSQHCNDGRKISLDCSDLYLQDANDDQWFYYVDNSSWLIESGHINNISYKHAPGTFCQVYIDQELKFIICLPDNAAFSNEHVWSSFWGFCVILSSIFLAITLIVYLILPELRELQDMAMMSMCASFMVAFFVHGVLKLNIIDFSTNDSICAFAAFLVYYSFLCGFFWLNVISLNIWKSVWFPYFEVKSNILYVVYCIFGWGVPLCFLVLVLVTHYVDTIYMKPGFGEDSCWFKEYSTTWLYFYGPVSVLLLMNLIYLGLTGWTLWHKYRNVSCSNVGVLRIKCALFVKLSLMMGATWIFEVISFAFQDSSPFIWILPDLLNSLQGLFIFCLFVVWRKKVKKLLAQRKPCNIKFPASWAHYKDNEKWDENEAEEFQLSQTLF